jgi:single-stranded DNA-specific DHH superfamily exonuclease
MLTQKEVEEIREHLDDAKNPIFLFDNDPDGLCSFLLLRSYIGRGRGVAIKSLPGLDKTYFKKVEEFNSDYIFVLDKPLIDKEFLDLAEKKNIPLVHIDHHQVERTPIVNYYNTFYSSGLSEPVAYLCYNIANKKEDMWISAIGCITDCYMPDYFDEFKKNYPELIDGKTKTPFDILYTTSFGKICMIVSFGLRDATHNVVSMMKLMMNAKGPHDLIDENPKTKSFLKRFEEVDEKYQRILKKAEECVEKDMIFFRYSGDMSINQYVANELLYHNPKKVVVVVYAKSSIANVSLRWDGDIRLATVNAIKDIEGATGGGHEHASGARVPVDKLDLFKENLLQEIEQIRKKKN